MICRKCQNDLPLENFYSEKKKLCKNCHKKEYEECKEKSLCIRCRKPLDRSGTTCTLCNLKIIEYHKSYRAKVKIDRAIVRAHVKEHKQSEFSALCLRYNIREYSGFIFQGLRGGIYFKWDNLSLEKAGKILEVLNAAGLLEEWKEKEN